MVSIIILIAVALGVGAAPAVEHHSHQEIHLQRLSGHKHNGHAPSAGTDQGAAVHGKKEDMVVVPRAVHAGASLRHLHSEHRPEWVRKRL